MPDVFTKARRSQVMAAIRSRGNNDTELAMIRLFRRHRITGWRRGVPLFGRPDFVFRAHRLAVFVDGCFWHQCPRHCRMPAGNRDFWAAKLAANRRRDRLVTRTLRALGWRVLRVWEHELSRRNEARLLRRLRRAMPGHAPAIPGP